MTQALRKYVLHFKHAYNATNQYSYEGITLVTTRARVIGTFSLDRVGDEA